MSLNARRFVIDRRFLNCCLLLMVLLAGFAGLSSVTRKVGAIFGAPGFSENRTPALRGTDTDLVNHARLRESYGRLPISFEANQGQTDGSVKFLSRGSGYSLFLTPTEAVLRLEIAGHRSGNERNKALAAHSGKAGNLKDRNAPK